MTTAPDERSPITDSGWVPSACTLPTVEQPLRLARFDDLFASSVRAVESVTSTHARLHLEGAAGLVANVQDLTARETVCCSFFRFAVTPEQVARGEALILAVEVPAEHADVLDALCRRARNVAGVTP